MIMFISLKFKRNRYQLKDGFIVVIAMFHYQGLVSGNRGEAGLIVMSHAGREPENGSESVLT